MNILIGGYAGHGKTTFARLFCLAAGIPFSCTWAIKLGLVYTHSDHGFRDTFENFNDFLKAKDTLRPALYNAINDLCREDPLWMAKEVKARCPVHVGMRSHMEFYACVVAGFFDLTVWVQGTGAVEGTDSCTVDSRDFDVIVDNNCSMYDLYRKASKLATAICI